jgi:hypothetical protein
MARANVSTGNGTISPGGAVDASSVNLYMSRTNRPTIAPCRPT